MAGRERVLRRGAPRSAAAAWPTAVLAPSSLWVVVSPDGAVLARTPVAKRYTVWNATPDGHFLATYGDKELLQAFAAKLTVAVVRSR